MPAGRGRSGKDDLVDAGMFAHRGADIEVAVVAGHHVQHPTAGSTVLASSTMRSVASGVSGEGLSTTAFPARIAGMMCQIAIITREIPWRDRADDADGLADPLDAAGFVILNDLGGQGQAGGVTRPCRRAAQFPA